jgi:hypothetical protein
MTSDNFEKVLHFSWRLHHVQTTAIDFNVCQAISVLTGFNSAFLKPHFQAIYTTVMDRTDANPMRAFSKARNIYRSSISETYTQFYSTNHFQQSTNWLCGPLTVHPVVPFRRVCTSAPTTRFAALSSPLLSDRSSHGSKSPQPKHESRFSRQSSYTRTVTKAKHTSAESRARIDPFDDTFYRLAIKYCDSPPSLQTRNAMRTFFIELCHEHGPEMRNLLTTSIQEQIAHLQRHLTGTNMI